jgi:hypothetical protein
MSDLSDIFKIIDSLSIQELLRRNKYGIVQKDGDPMNFVVLIDEYDYPLLHNISDDVKVSEVRQILSIFYGAIKSCFELLRFLLLSE